MLAASSWPRDSLPLVLIDLKESNQCEELKDGMLYIKLQKKLPAQMLAAYHRWVFENHRVECVEVLREWVIQELNSTLEPWKQFMG